MRNEIAFEMAASSIRFGPGVTREVGMDLADPGARKVLVITDPVLSDMKPVQTVLESLEGAGVNFVLYDRVRVEPTDESFLDAIAFAKQAPAPYDAYVAVGGGSTIDTAKAVNLYVTYPPADFLDYVNPPIGKGVPVPGPLKPLFAIPTTAGTGSETTGVSIFDLIRMHAKTGIASRRLKPTLGPAGSGEHPQPASGRLPHPVAWTFSVTRSNLTPRYRTRAGRTRSGHWCARRIKDRIRSAMSGLCRPCAWWRSTSFVPWTIHPTMKRAPTCCWRPLMRAWDLGTRACICRTECRIQCRETSRAIKLPATFRIIR